MACTPWPRAYVLTWLYILAEQLHILAAGSGKDHIIAEVRDLHGPCTDARHHNNNWSSVCFGGGALAMHLLLQPYKSHSR